MNLKKLNEKLIKLIEEQDIDSYAILVRDYHNGICSLYYTKNESDAREALKLLQKLEDAPEDMTEDEYEVWSQSIWNKVDKLLIDSEEVSRRDIEDGYYANVLIVNNIPVDIY